MWNRWAGGKWRWQLDVVVGQQNGVKLSRRTYSVRQPFVDWHKIASQSLNCCFLTHYNVVMQQEKAVEISLAKLLGTRQAQMATCEAKRDKVEHCEHRLQRVKNNASQPPTTLPHDHEQQGTLNRYKYLTRMQSVAAASRLCAQNTCTAAVTTSTRTI